ncbi:MAG: RNA polymerase sigma factor [Fibrobacteres bacterium]|nr:RNA polymerase sigma factor [Fibrobacterota bacterium]
MTESLDGPALALLRDLAPRALGAVHRRWGDFAAAEDSVQEALVAAVDQWPKEGIPDSPMGWLIRVASRRLADHFRSEGARRRREELVVSMVPPDEQWAAIDAGAPEADDTLDLLFLCCHPALTPASAIALTLRAVGGLTTAEIAKAFLVPEATMAQRISRAKQAIKEAGSAFDPPSPEEAARRLASVQHVLYLIFNEGYTASSGEALVRVDLSAEAIRIARMLRQAVPGDAETEGLLALLLLTDARRAARTGAGGELIPLDKQDRALWDRARIAEGTALITTAFSRGPAGAYAIQAAIAALHDEAEDMDATDWPQILELYGWLLRTSDNPMAKLNHAVATAMVHGPSAGLALIDGMAGDTRLAGQHRLQAARAHLLERAGDKQAACDAYRMAAERATCVPERDYLLLQAARMREDG